MNRTYSLSIYLALVMVCIFIAIPSDAKVPDTVLSQKYAVVTVYVDDKKGNHLDSGTGFIIDQDGIIVTNCKVISKWFEKAENMIKVEITGGKQFPLGDLISSKCENNLALIKIEASGLPSVKINANYKPKQGEHISVIQRHPKSQTIASDGMIKNILKQDKLIQTSIPVTLNNSGSPLFNRDGEVIGAAVFLSRKNETTNITALLKNIPKQLERYKKTVALKKNAPKSYQPQQETKKITGNANEYFLLGCNYENSHQYKEAIEAYKESLRTDPKFPDAYVSLGVVYYKLGKYTNAIEAFKEAAKIEPNSLSLYNKLGTTYIIRGAYPQAVDTFRKAADIYPNSAEAHFNLGIAYFLIGNKTAAFEEYVILRDIDKQRADILRDILIN